MNTVFTEQDICFIPDASESEVYYYIAAHPTVITDQRSKPKVHFTVYKNGIEIYATLEISSDLQASLQMARQAATLNKNIPPDAILLPLQTISSMATISIPDMLSVEMPASIGNSNLCIFSTSLTNTQNIQTLSALLREPESVPLSIIYKLDYLYEMPPSSFELEAKWDQVYNYLKEIIHFNALVFQINIENISSKLINNKTVNIKVKSTDPDSHIEDAAKELTAILLTEFFVPVGFRKEDTSSPQSGIGFNLQRISITNLQNRTFSASLIETRVVKRSVFPQTLFAAFVKGTDYQYNDIVLLKKISDKFFQKRTIKVSLINQELYNEIGSVIVSVDYNGRQDLLFDHNDSDTQQFERYVITLPDGNIDWIITYSFLVIFNQSTAGVLQVSSTVLTTESDHLFIDLESVLGVYEFTVQTALNFNWSWYNTVLAKVSGHNRNKPENTISYPFLLSSQCSSYTKKVLIPYLDEFDFDVRLDYSANSNMPHLTTSIQKPVNQNIHVFGKLFKQRSVKLVEQYDWKIVKEVTVFVTFPIQQNTQKLSQTFVFNNGEPNEALFTADRPTPDDITVFFQIIIQYHNNSGYQEKMLSAQTDQDIFVLPQ